MYDIDVFSETVRWERKKQGLSQKELAEKAGIAAATLSSYEAIDERHRRGPSLECALIIAKALGVSLDWLCGITPAKLDDTYDIFEILYAVVKNDNATIGRNHIREATSIYFKDNAINGFLADLDELTDLYKRKTLSLGTYEASVQGVISKYQNDRNTNT